MTQKITSFDWTKYDFLSNFHPAHIIFEGVAYPTSEHAYQASKTFNERQRAAIQTANCPGRAKALGQHVDLRPNWEEIKIDVMREILRVKFAPKTRLAKMLVNTGDAILIEGNTWNDTFWGECPLGNGQNWLGKLLMEIRKELQQ